MMKGQDIRAGFGWSFEGKTVFAKQIDFWVKPFVLFGLASTLLKHR
jgi:hypothetical protein